MNATYRDMTHAVDDMRINALCGVRHGNLWPIANPGEKVTVWGTTAQGCAQNGWVTIDTSKEGYITAGSNKIIGYKVPERTYKAVEIQIDRAWDDKWAFNASYLWSKLEGNHEGPVNSDTNYGDTGMVQHWDHPANNERSGYLFNDHRHKVKLRGSYKLNEQWLFGATFVALSGGPITAFGVSWPGEDSVASYTSEGSGGGTGWICVSNCTAANAQRVYEYSPRGAFGNMPWTYDLGANVIMDPAGGGCGHEYPLFRLQPAQRPGGHQHPQSLREAAGRLPHHLRRRHPLAVAALRRTRADWNF